MRCFVICWIAVCIFTSLYLPNAAANVIVTLAPQNDNTTVGLGTTVTVDVLLSADGADNPLPDIRQMQFDFGDTSSSIQLGTFQWVLDLDNDSFYLKSTNLPVTNAVFFGTMTIEGFIVNLDDVPLRVATITATINGDGTLDAVGNSGDANQSGAIVTARFDQPKDYTRATGSLHGGLLEFQTESVPNVPDTDGDGAPDSVDAFPNNNQETTDTDNDNIGNVADTDDDGDNIPDGEDSSPLGPAQLGNDNTPAGNANANSNTSGNLNANANANHNANTNTNSNTSGGGNDNDTNMGPRATGGLCASGMLSTMLLTITGLLATQLARQRMRVS